MSKLFQTPFASAHRAGNNSASAREAVKLGAHLIETDIWLHRGRLELRHKNTLGPIPILWERWSIAPGWGPRYQLKDLLDELADSVLLFLDLKGKDPHIGPAIVDELNRLAPNRIVATCGRDYDLLDPIANEPNILTFYSVGDDKEWAPAQERIRKLTHPALSLKAELATPDKLAFMEELGGTTVCWGVKDTAQAETLRELGVDGFTTDNPDLIAILADHPDQF